MYTIAKERGTRVTIVSGDVHLGAFSYLRSHVKGKDKLPQACDPGFMPQIVTSGIGAHLQRSLPLSLPRAHFICKANVNQQPLAHVHRPPDSAGGLCLVIMLTQRAAAPMLCRVLTARYEHA